MAIIFGQLFAEEVKKLILAKAETVAEEIIRAPGAASYEEYKEKIGRIHGLRMALECFEEAEQIALDRERGK